MARYEIRKLDVNAHGVRYSSTLEYDTWQELVSDMHNACKHKTGKSAVFYGKGSLVFRDGKKIGNLSALNSVMWKSGAERTEKPLNKITFKEFAEAVEAQWHGEDFED